MRRFMKTVAVAAVTALALTACSSDGDGTAVAVGSDASPAEVIAAGIANTFSAGSSFTLSMEGDLEKANASSTDPMDAELLALFADGLISGAFSPEGAFQLKVGSGDGVLELRVIDEAMYLRLNLDEAARLAPDLGPIPSASEIEAQIGFMGLPAEVNDVVVAGAKGEWVGITGLTAEALEQLASTAGGTLSIDEADAEGQAQKILDDLGLSDGTSFVEEFLEISGEGPTYDVVVKARALFAALESAASSLEDVAGTGGMDYPDSSEVPETLSGMTMTVEGNRMTRATIDIAEMAQAAGEDTEGLEPGDVNFVMEFGEIGDRLDVPGGAVTIDFETLSAATMGAFMGG